MYEYICLGCRKNFSFERYYEGFIYCPTCGSQYDINVLRHNNIRKKRADYISKRINSVLFLGSLLAILIPLTTIYIAKFNPQHTEWIIYLIFGGLGIWIISILAGGFFLKSNAKKIFPD